MYLPVPSLNFNCITFGSPPTGNFTFATMCREERARHRLRHSHIDFLNEFDLVPRLDRQYVLSLIDLYRSRYSQPPLSAAEDNLKGLGSLADDLSTAEAATPNFWRLPNPVFYHAGDLVMLSIDESFESEEGESAAVRATEIDHKTLGTLLFCRIAAHKIAVYVVNIEALCNQCLLH